MIPAGLIKVPWFCYVCVPAPSDNQEFAVRVGDQFKRRAKISTEHDIAVCITENVVLSKFTGSVKNVIQVLGPILIAVDLRFMPYFEVPACLSCSFLIAEKNHLCLR